METELKQVNWPNIFSRYEQSGLNQHAFCEREGLKFIEFKYQRTKYLKRQTKSSGFASIQVKGGSGYELEVVLPQGHRLKFKQGVPVDYVKRLLQALR